MLLKVTKKNSRRIIKSNLQSDFNNNLLRISDTGTQIRNHKSLHTTLAPISENDYPPIYPRPSGFTKQGEIIHDGIEEKTDNKQRAVPEYLTNPINYSPTNKLKLDSIFPSIWLFPQPMNDRFIQIHGVVIWYFVIQMLKHE